jgi:hypothetical protein
VVASTRVYATFSDPSLPVRTVHDKGQLISNYTPYRPPLSPQSTPQTLPCTSQLVSLSLPFVLWIRRIFPNPRKSSSESSLLEKQTQEKLLFYREFATPPTAQKSTPLIHRDVAIRYVLVPSCASDLIIQPLQVQLNPTIEVGQSCLCRSSLIRGSGLCSVASMTSSTNLFSHAMMVMFSTTPAEWRPVVKTS